MTPTAKPKVMLIINSLTGGGAERVITTVLSYSESYRTKFDISLALLDIEDVKFAPPDWVRIHQLDCRFSTAATIIQLRRLFSREKPDLVVSFLTRANIGTQIAIRPGNTPHIISQRSNATKQLGFGLRAAVTKWLVRATYPHANRVIAVSTGVAADLMTHYRVKPHKIVVIPNPVDPLRLRQAAASEAAIQIDRPYVLGVGRIVAAKNFDMLIRAFAKSGIAGRLVIIGEGPARPPLEALAHQLGVGDRVIFTGFLSNPYPLMSQASVFALSSSYEGFPNALVEALALGVPVVATNCRDGPAEILTGKNPEAIQSIYVGAGIITPVDDVDSFARALVMATAEPLRSSLAAAGERQVKSYSPEIVVKSYWSVIEDALRNSASSPQA